MLWTFCIRFGIKFFVDVRPQVVQNQYTMEAVWSEGRVVITARCTILFRHWQYCSLSIVLCVHTTRTTSIWQSCSICSNGTVLLCSQRKYMYIFFPVNSEMKEYFWTHYGRVLSLSIIDFWFVGYFPIFPHFSIYQNVHTSLNSLCR